MSSKKTSKTTSNQTQTAAPPSWTAGPLATAAGMVGAGLGQIPQQHYDGQQVAYLDPNSLSAIQGAWGDTANLANYYSNWMGQNLNQFATPYDFTTSLPTQQFDVGSLQDVTPVINAALAPVYKQLTQQILPGIKSSSLDAGAYTGDRAMGILPQSVLDDYSRQAQNTAATIGYQNYNDFENRRLNAFQSDQDRMLAAYGAETQRGLGQESANATSMGAINDYISGILRNSASVGDLLNMSAQLGVTNDQAMINDALSRDQYASYSPFMGLDQASQLLAQLSGNYGTQTSQGTSKTTEKTGGLGEWVKGAIGLGTMIAGAATGNPLAMLGGATAGVSGTANPLSASVAGQTPNMASMIFGTGRSGG